MTRHARCVMASPGRRFRVPGGRGAYAIRALPDLCLGIVSGRLAAARLLTVTFKLRHARGFLLDDRCISGDIKLRS
jgi:hypothetical protein